MSVLKQRISVDSTNLLFGGCVYQEYLQSWTWMIATEEQHWGRKRHLNCKKKLFAKLLLQKNFGFNFLADWRNICLKSIKIFKKQKLHLNIFKWIWALVLIYVSVDILGSVLKRFNDSGEMAIENAVQTVLQNLSARTSNK